MPRLDIKGASDSTFKEARHCPNTLVWVIKEVIMACILLQEDL